MILTIISLIAISVISDIISKFFFKDMKDLRSVIMHTLIYFIIFISLLATFFPLISIGLILVLGAVNACAHFFVDYVFEHLIKKRNKHIEISEEIILIMILISTFHYIVGF